MLRILTAGCPAVGGSFVLLVMLASHAAAIPVTNPATFSGPMQVIDYRNSPIGLLPNSTSITNQYASLGVLHDGSTTTPPGPPGMSSPSGLPGLESNVGDPDPNLPITITFTRPYQQVGAYFLMAGANDSMTLTAFRANSTVIDSATILPAAKTRSFRFQRGLCGIDCE